MPVDVTASAEHEPVGDDRALILRMLELSPEERLQGLVQAAAFFAAAQRV